MQAAREATEEAAAAATHAAAHAFAPGFDVAALLADYGVGQFASLLHENGVEGFRELRGCTDM